MDKVLILDNKGDIFAWFVDTNECYSHIGQHSEVHKDYVRESKVCRDEWEIDNLLAELVSIGYTDVVCENYRKIECWRPPTEGEIKFGHGATHYSSFYYYEIGHNKNGDLKKHFISKDDNLRYNR